MKWLFLILLLLNLGFFAFMQWDSRQSGESLEAHAPVNETKIKVLPAPTNSTVTQTPTP